MQNSIGCRGNVDRILHSLRYAGKIFPLSLIFKVADPSTLIGLIGFAWDIPDVTGQFSHRRGVNEGNPSDHQFATNMTTDLSTHTLNMCKNNKRITSMTFVPEVSNWLAKTGHATAQHFAARYSRVLGFALALAAALLIANVISPPGVGAHPCEAVTHQDFAGTACGESGHDNSHENVIEVDGGRNRQLELRTYLPSNGTILSANGRITIVLAGFDLSNAEFDAPSTEIELSGSNDTDFVNPSSVTKDVATDKLELVLGPNFVSPVGDPG